MKGKNMTYTLLLGVAITFGHSCVRDKVQPCPPLQVNIEVKDKNYSNVDKVALEEKLPEDLAFCKYIPTLYYMLRDAATGKVVEEQGVFKVDGDEKNFPITFCDTLPHGKYVFTVWGGLDAQTPISDDHTVLTFHPNHTEGKDIYLTNDTLVYDAWNYAHTVRLERTKGKLIVQGINLPEEISRTEKSIEGLYGKVDSRFNYSDATYVQTEYRWDNPVEIVTKTLLSPSPWQGGSKLNVNFHRTPQQENSDLIPKEVKITMKRNELTVLRYVYENEGDFSIYILVNDNWEEIHGMEID